MTICPPTGAPQTPLTRNASARRLSHPQHLSSSEVTPSEHSSLYDAAPLTTVVQRAKRFSWCSEDSSEDVPTAPKQPMAGVCEPEDAGRHVGTRLFTIIEQKSVPSLKTTPSSWSFQRRAFTLQPKLSSDVAQAHHSRTARRRCYSADERILHVYRHKSDLSSPSSGEASSESQCPDGDTTTFPILPVEPLYRPPERVQTPTGLPRWPGERDHDQTVVRQLTVKTSRRDLWRQFLRAPQSRPKIREVLRGERTANFDQAVRTGTRFWRPPTSGHTTRRYEDLESHPFSFVPIAKPRVTGTTQREQPAIASGGQPNNGESNMHHSGHAGGKSPSGQPCPMSESMRALRGASQSAMPVPLRRASAQANTRSSVVPLHARTLPVVERTPNQTSQSPNLDTMRTVDLFESFPSLPANQRRQSQPAKRTSWSIFPFSDRQEDSEEVLPKPQKRQAPAHSDESEASNVAIRGESQARYRESGTPIYDPDSVSLRSLDQEVQRSHGVGSAVLGSTTLEPRLRRESQRAISNGALRFSTLLESTTSEHSRPCIQIGNAENNNPKLRDIPEPHQMCKHKIGKLRSLQKKHPHLVPTPYDTIHLDGTSAPAPLPPPPILAQDYAPTGPSISTRARASIAPVQNIELDRPPTTTTFVTAPNGATTFTTSPTMGPFGRSTTLASAETSTTMPGRA